MKCDLQSNITAVGEHVGLYKEKVIGQANAITRLFTNKGTH